MLGGSLEKDRYSNTALLDYPNPCLCSISKKCNIGDLCECKDFCSKYYEMYSNITLAQWCYLTYSPNPDTEAKRGFWFTDSTHEVSKYRDIAETLRKCRGVGEFILVPELTQKGQIHFHAIIEVIDKIKFIRSVIQKLYWYGNVLALYNKHPKQGVHYLFKTARFMGKFLDSPPVLTRSVVDTLISSDDDQTA